MSNATLQFRKELINICARILRRLMSQNGRGFLNSYKYLKLKDLYNKLNGSTKTIKVFYLA